jgi:glycosyltransferase involved in cell wall biosynthesis
MRVLICHPNRQHSHQLALALHEAGALTLYIYGANPPAGDLARLSQRVRRRISWCLHLGRVIAYASPMRFRNYLSSIAMSLFDLQMMRYLRASRCDVVIAYENAAGKTFGAARKLGILCVLDATSIHYKSQISLLPRSNTKRSIRCKEREIRLADIIITCSSLARDSYIGAGVPPHLVYSIPLGVDLTLFTRAGKSSRNDAPITFCNAGVLAVHKGTDLIVEACSTLRKESEKFDFIIAGNRATADPNLVSQLEAVAKLRGRVPHHELPEFYSKADVFVSPSRIDSFGMVVLEALACGLPVILSDNVGAKEVITEGVNGWIIPSGDVRALAQRMAWCVANPDKVRAMALAARASAERYAWSRYRNEVVQVIKSRFRCPH